MLILVATCAIAVGMLAVPRFMSSGRGSASAQIDVRPHPNLSRGVRMSQVIPPMERGSPGAGADDCISILFATHGRRNSAMLEVAFENARGRRSTWLVDSSELDDNSFRPFCPDAGGVAHGGRLTITSRSGGTGDSPTVWMTKDDRLGRLDGPLGAQGYAVRLRLENGAVNTLGRAIDASSGGFVLYSLLSGLIAGITILMAASRRVRDAGGPTAA
ncbi:hypothetical protein [Coralloluteibacterium stylophorae]|uniref:Uncharacterized protein n=1 Tax=Coralloluteibacterium stylophorae TaxID=1776034 RepID=A0A8J7VYL2_9GAMM|nr:hypothetical protein [Coralloluteibacterium stylophorae]MBS7457825.1 hypothetical protein [Coralloluteibacterium stylophorae]